MSRNKAPVMYPALHVDDLQGVSKNALIDLVWRLAEMDCCSTQKLFADSDIAAHVRQHLDYVVQRRGEKPRRY